MAQGVKDPTLSLLWHRFDSSPGNFCMPWVWPRKKKKKGMSGRGNSECKGSEAVLELEERMLWIGNGLWAYPKQTGQ